MPDLRGLTLVVASDDAERFACAVEMAASWAALGGRARLFCRGSAVRLLDDPALAEAMAGGVEVIACQSGLAEHDVTLIDHDTRIVAGGMVSLLADLSDDRLTIL